MFLAPATPRGRTHRQSAIRNNVEAYDWVSMVTTIDDAFRTARDAVGTFTYTDGHAECARLARTHNVTHATAAGIVAALSPSTAWERNLQLADTMLATGDAAHAYGDCIRKARKIRSGADPYTILGGRKVRSFYHGLTNPDTAHVTIDRH